MGLILGSNHYLHVFCIPNSDPADKTPRESIVVGANRVHEDKSGKGMWMKVLADGETKVTRSVMCFENLIPQMLKFNFLETPSSLKEF